MSSYHENTDRSDRDRYKHGDDEDHYELQSELRRKTKEIQKLLVEKRSHSGRNSSSSNNNNNVFLKSSEPSRSTHSHISSQPNRNKDHDFDISASDVNSDSTSNISSDHRFDRGKQLKHLKLTPNYRNLSGNETSGVEICKKLFGIIIFEYSNGKHHWNKMAKDRKLVIQGVQEGTESHASGKIHRGDMLVRINDANITWQNCHRVLSSLKKRERVKLTFQSPRIVGPKSRYSILQVPDADLCLAVLGRTLADVQGDLTHCSVMALTLVQGESETDVKEDIIYSFPPGEESLLALRGLFLTLSSSLRDVVGQSAHSSHLSVTGISVNVVYHQMDKDLLVFAMPENRVSLQLLESVISGFSSLLVLLFGDVKKAFMECERTWLDRLLAVILYRALNGDPSLVFCSPTTNLLPNKEYNVVKTLLISNENKLLCDEVLSELESMDFDDFLDQQDLFSRRKYTIRGTSLFYKEYIVCSHLCEGLQQDINLFFNCHGLLSLSSRQKVMVWQELKQASEEDVSSLPTGYRPCDSRNFLLIVGLNDYYLCLIVEAGGCSAMIHGEARPMPLLVQQGKATLGQLDRELHLAAACEDSLANTAGSIALCCPDSLVIVTSPRTRSNSRGRGKSRPPLISTKSSSVDSIKARSKSMDKQGSEDDPDSSAIMRRQGSKHSYGSNDSAGSGSSAGPAKSKSSNRSSMADLSSISRSVSVLQVEAPYDFIRKERLTRGAESTLMTYVQLDYGQGILIVPTEAEMREVQSRLQEEVVDNFCRACHHMRSSFVRSRKMKSKTSEELSNETFEQGVLFQLESPVGVDKKRISTLTYWVVARSTSTPSPQELYVCFHESTQQSMVEMAFSLGFGT